MTDQKQCRACGHTKDVGEFYLTSRGQRDTRCKKCHNGVHRRKCRGCGDKFRVECFPLLEGRLSRSYWCVECTQISRELRLQSDEHRRFRVDSARIARTREEVQEWIDEGAEVLRAQTDAVRPVRTGGEEVP